MGTNKITGLGNGTAAQDAVAFTQIKYLQAVQATTVTQTTTTSSTFAACTNFSVAITPTSASNRVKITVAICYAAGSATSYINITIKRGSTELSGQTGGFWFSRNCETGAGFSYIDSPATTSSTTYQVFIRSSNNTDTVTLGTGTALNVITAEEIV